MSLADLLSDPVDEVHRISLAVVEEVGRALGLDVEGAGLFRVSTSTLVGLPAAGLLARLDDPAHADDAERQVLIADVLDAAGVPAVRLAGPAGPEQGEWQPVRTAVGAITFWRYEPPAEIALTHADIGRLARQLHDAFRVDAPGEIPSFDPFAAIARQLGAAEQVGATDADALARLRSVAAELRAGWDAVAGSDPLGVTLVHGDLHEHNVLSTARGPVLADLELAGMGPASYDLVPSLVAVERYGKPIESYLAFGEAYGHDVRDWGDGCRLMVEVYELWVTAWIIGNQAVSPRHREEAQVRLRRWTDPDAVHRAWRLL